MYLLATSSVSHWGFFNFNAPEPFGLSGNQFLRNTMAHPCVNYYLPPENKAQCNVTSNLDFMFCLIVINLNSTYNLPFKI